MIQPDAFLIFLSAALVLAITPGPGILYVLTRSLKGGRAEGYLSSLGTALGGLFHVFAAALGVSVLLASSALAFSLVKYLGAGYLVYLGVKTLLESRTVLVDTAQTNQAQTLRRVFWQGVTVEALNPKTALFFLAFIPQFISPEANVFLQFALLGSLSVTLNTCADLIVASLAGPIGKALSQRPNLQRTQRVATGVGLIGLGAYVALAGE